MTEITSRLSTALADRYKIESHLGEGGMANVYLAHDLKHDRKVAVKVLRPELAAVLGAERFIQEIKTTANLQHPHILPLFDSGEADSFLYYVMPFIDGETLRDKLNRETQLGIDEAVGITTAIADALDYAHRNNVIHRDIKPENILLHDGRPMVADFGIALALSAAAGGRMTETGMSLGTPHYMSPEQATAEKHLTSRSDIYSLGCVLYEMLTGEPPHTGGSAQAIIMKIVTDTPRPLTELRKSVPPHVAAATAKSLEKLAADRFTTAAKFAEALTNPAFTRPTSMTGPAREPASGVRRYLWPAAAAVFAIAFGWSLLRPAPSARSLVTRFTVPVPGGHMMRFAEDPQLAISPDGRTLAYIKNDMVNVRRLDLFESVALEGSEGAQSLFFSPDGEWIGFVQGGGIGGLLKKVPLSGGPILDVAEVVMSFDPGASWGPDGTIVYASNNSRSRGIWQVDEGGTPHPITTIADTLGENYHLWPQLLDGGRLLLYTVVGPIGLWEDSRIVIQDLETSERQVVRERATYGRYVATGHILYADAMGTILAVPFDVENMAVTGVPFAVESAVRVARWGGAASFAISDSGVAAFVRGSNAANNLLVWVDRTGQRLRQLGEPVTVSRFRLSRDGLRLATWIHDAKNPDVWVVDAVTAERHRLTFAEAWEWTPVWSPGDRQIALTVSTNRGTIAIKEVDTGTETQRLDVGRQAIWLTDWSSDGKWIAYDQDSFNGLRDVVVARVDSVEHRIRVGETARDECCAQFSPDGRWLAYVEDGEVYVVSFPELEAKQQVSSGGGLTPRWSSDGNALFFWRDSTLMTARILPGPNFQHEAPHALFVAPDINLVGPDYDVAPDGETFLISVMNPDARAREIHVVLNWFEELRANVGN